MLMCVRCMYAFVAQARVGCVCIFGGGGQYVEAVGLGLGLDSHLPVMGLQAGSVLMALATAEPSSAARLLGQLLSGLRESAAKLAMLCAQTKIDDSGQSSGPGTPRGLRGSGTEVLKEAMDAVHGYSLGASAVLVAVTRFAIMLPVQLTCCSCHLRCCQF